MATNKKATVTAQDAPAHEKITDYNRVELGGRLVEDVELRYTPTGRAVCNLRVATNDTKIAQFHDVVAWEALAESIATLTKGTPITISGHIQTRTWRAEDGTNRRWTEIVASALAPRGVAE